MPGRKENNPFRNYASGPLLSWDIFMNGYWRQIALANDKQALNKIAASNSWQQQWNFDTILSKEGRVIIVTDPLLHIVFASSNMPAMNGYTPQEVLGKSPKIFQGKDTDEDTRAGIRSAITERKQFQASLINYKKNGNSYHCDVEGYPVFNKEDKLVNFIAFEQVLSI